MVRVKFLEDFDYKPAPQMTVGYRAGWSGTVKRDCAEKAAAAKKAELLDAKLSQEDRFEAEKTGSGKAE